MKFIIFFFLIFMSEGIKEAQAVIVNNPQPMFECADARYDDEKFVCADSELSELNKESNDWYQKLTDFRRNYTHELPKFERDYVCKSQSLNMLRRNSCLRKGELAKKCLTEFYQKNIQLLKDTLLGFSLMTACSGEDKCDFSMADSMIADGADINGYIDYVPAKYCFLSSAFPFLDGVPVYYMAIGNAKGSKALAYVLEKGAKIGTPGKFSASELCRDFNLEEMKVLLANQVNMGDYFSPPLFFRFLAAGIDSAEKVEIVKLFIEKRGTVDFPNPDAWSALTMLLSNTETAQENAAYVWQVAQMLVEHGANVWQTDKTGRNALAYLEQNDVLKKSPYYDNLRNIILYGNATIHPEFDCANAETDAEKLICRDDELAQLDIDMNYWLRRISEYREKHMSALHDVGSKYNNSVVFDELYSKCDSFQKDFRDCVKTSYEQYVQSLKNEMLVFSLLTACSEKDECDFSLTKQLIEEGATFIDDNFSWLYGDLHKALFSQAWNKYKHLN